MSRETLPFFVFLFFTFLQNLDFFFFFSSWSYYILLHHYTMVPFPLSPDLTPQTSFPQKLPSGSKSVMSVIYLQWKLNEYYRHLPEFQHLTVHYQPVIISLQKTHFRRHNKVTLANYEIRRWFHLALLNTVRNSFIRIATGAFRTSPVFRLCSDAIIPSLHYRRLTLTAKLLTITSQYPKILVQDLPL